MPRISRRVLAFRERQRRGAVMHPGTFAEIEREAAAGGARDPRAVAGAAYWKTLAARYRGNPISEEPDPKYPGELRFVEWRRAMLTFIISHWYGGTLSDGEIRHISHIVHMPPEAGADWSFIRDADDQDVIAVFLYVQSRHPELGPHRGFNPRSAKLDAFTKKHLETWLANQFAHAPRDKNDARRAIMRALSEEPGLLEQSRSWPEIMRIGFAMQGNPRGKDNPYFQETRTRGSRQVVIWANDENGPFHVDKYLNHGETPAGRLIARPLKSLKKARERGDMWLEAMSRSNPREKQRTFRDVAIGEAFEFWDPWRSSMRGPWIKKSARTYVLVSDQKGTVYRVGSISAKVLPTGVLANPDGGELPEAERLYETFHGREPREILELTTAAIDRGEYTALGDLVELTLETPEGEHVKIGFKNDGVRLASTADGTQLALLGGNQDVSGTLKMFGSADMSKDLLDLGEARQIVYDAAKWQTDFTPQEWKHDFGEESGIRPRAFFDQLNKRIFFAGGNYRVERPGIVD